MGVIMREKIVIDMTAIKPELREEAFEKAEKFIKWFGDNSTGCDFVGGWRVNNECCGCTQTLTIRKGEAK